MLASYGLQSIHHWSSQLVLPSKVKNSSREAATLVPAAEPPKRLAMDIQGPLPKAKSRNQHLIVLTDLNTKKKGHNGRYSNIYKRRDRTRQQLGHPI